MIYIDSMQNRGREEGQRCHMIADSLDELHAMAEKIGLRREWFKEDRFPHYDLTEGNRIRAVYLGARQVRSRQLAATAHRLYG